MIRIYNPQGKIVLTNDFFAGLVGNAALVQPLQGVEITAAQENDGTLLRRIGFLALVFRKEEQGLGNGGQNFLKGVFTLPVKDDFGNAVYFSVADTVHIGEGVASGKALGGIDVIVFLLFGEPCVELRFINMESHSLFLLFLVGLYRLFCIDYRK